MRKGRPLLVSLASRARARAAGARLAVAALGALLLVPVPAPAQEDERAGERRAMVARALASPRLGGSRVTDEAVLEAMRAVPRHEFVPEAHRAAAYRNTPLPIGHGQTISQPTIVGRMTAMAELEPGEKALEVGTGSGYQAAVLAEVTDSVWSVEIIPELAASARERLRRTGYDALGLKQGDGYFGWPEHAPYDAIVVTAAPTHIPPPLIEQLAPGGRMVIPVGPPFRTQQLMLVEKRDDGTVVQRAVAAVRFVPFRRSEEGG